MIIPQVFAGHSSNSSLITLPVVIKPYSFSTFGKTVDDKANGNESFEHAEMKHKHAQNLLLEIITVPVCFRNISYQ
jgi:hypothetical protein